MTEVCYASEFEDYQTDGYCPDIPRNDFEDSMQWGQMLFADFNIAGVSAWIYWNLILDPAGGPWLISPPHNDPVKNPQQPVIIADPNTGTYTLTGCYYAMNHFSRYLDPGAVRIALGGMTGLYPTVKVTAFVKEGTGTGGLGGPDEGKGDKVTVVLMNYDGAAHTVTLVLGELKASVQLPAVSFTTLSFLL